MSVITNGPATSPGPFEGPEKLLEVWFAPSPDRLPEAGPSTPLTRRPRGGEDEHQSWRGLRKVPREVWEEMLDIVKCKVLSVVEGEELDAYLLRWVPCWARHQSCGLTISESSLFVAPHLVILKTCGTTLNLLGLYRIIEIARQYCGFHNVWRYVISLLTGALRAYPFLLPGASIRANRSSSPSVKQDRTGTGSRKSSSSTRCLAPPALPISLAP